MNTRSKGLLTKLGKTYLMVNGAVFAGSFLLTVVGHYF